MSTAHPHKSNSHAINLRTYTGALGAISTSRIAQYVPLKALTMPSCFFRAMGSVPGFVKHTRTLSSRLNLRLRLNFAVFCQLDRQPVVTGGCA